jgi:hypothetical protein
MYLNFSFLLNKNKKKTLFSISNQQSFNVVNQTNSKLFLISYHATPTTPTTSILACLAAILAEL